MNELGKGHTQALAKTYAHHYKGAVIFDPLKTNRYRLIPINFDGNGFVEYDTYYTKNHEVSWMRADSIYLDDLHCSMIDDDYIPLMKQVIADTKPSQVISGDVFDGQSLNHHEQKRVGYHSSRMSLRHELDFTKDVIRQLVPSEGKFVLLSSNHHNFLEKFMTDPRNIQMLDKYDAALIYRTLAYMTENSYLTPRGGVKFSDPMKFLFADMFLEGSVVSKAVERFNISLNNHGHEYLINANIGNVCNTKMVAGHVHAPKQRKGLISVGSAQINNPEYQGEMSASAHALCIIHENGKRTLLVDL